MKTDNTYHYLKRFHEELGLAIESLLNRIEDGEIPQEIKFYEMSVRVKNKFIRLGFLVETEEFYLQGENSENKIKHIML